MHRSGVMTHVGTTHGIERLVGNLARDHCRRGSVERQHEPSNDRVALCGDDVQHSAVRRGATQRGFRMSDGGHIG
jgi:hypothetical protein